MVLKMKVLFLLICLFIPLQTVLAAEKMTDNWHLAGYTKYRDAVFVDTARISSSSTGMSTVWIKIAPSNKSKYRQMISEFLGAVHKDNSRFKSIEILCDINCQDHLIRYVKFVYLDQDRDVIHESFETRPQWLRIVQGSLWYPVEKETCTVEKASSR